MASTCLNGWRCSAIHCQRIVKEPRTVWPKASPFPRLSKDLSFKGLTYRSAKIPSLWGAHESKKNGMSNVMSPDISTTPIFAPESLDAFDDEYDGLIIDPQSLPSSANAFVSALRASLSNWRLKGKKGVWLKMLPEQSDLVPIAIQEGFRFHHAEPSYVMLTYWIPEEPCLLPGSPSHQIGIGGFVMNDSREMLVVKEKCPSSCSGMWKIPTGYINQAEDLFSGAVREVKEETGVDTIFLEMVAFRHAHRVAFEKSDLLFVCMLRPLSFEITVDEKELLAAKWMAVEEFVEQPFYKEDEMSMQVMDICFKAFEDRYAGFTARELASKLDGKLSYLYYNQGFMI